MPTEYPDDSVQGFVDPWWAKTSDKEVGRGRLIRALVLYPDQKPYRVTPEGRGDDPTDHSHARLRVEPFSFDSAPRRDSLPVAGLPLRKGESFIASRGKVRPCVVLSTGGPQVEKYLRLGAAAWQSAATMLVAPFYGADQDGSRGGWNPAFVERIRHAEYPQYLWDKLPLGGSTESPQAPEISRLTVDGTEKAVRFDGLDEGVLIDRKVSVTTFPKSQAQALRQSEALRANGLTGRWEVPTEAEASRARRMFEKLGITNIEVRVVTYE